MVLFGEINFRWSKLVVIGQICCIRAKWLYSDKVVVFGKICCNWAKVVVFGQK